MLPDFMIVPESLTRRVGLSIKNHLQMANQQVCSVSTFSFDFFNKNLEKTLNCGKSVHDVKEAEVFSASNASVL